MESIQIQTAQHVDIDFEVAGLGDRLIAALIDYLLLASYLLLIGLISGIASSTAVFVVLYIPAFFYFLICEITLDGQSVGKKIRHLKVAMLDGSQPTAGSYALRWLLRFVDITLTFGMAGVVTLLVNGKGQRLGDLAAGTTVVKIQPRINLRDTLFTHLDDEYTPTFYQVEDLTPADIVTAKDVLNTLLSESRTHTTFQLGLKMKGVLERKMGVTSGLTPPDFLRTVIRDYNYVHGRI